MKRNNIVV